MRWSMPSSADSGPDFSEISPLSFSEISASDFSEISMRPFFRNLTGYRPDSLRHNATVLGGANEHRVWKLFLVLGDALWHPLRRPMSRGLAKRIEANDDSVGTETATKAPHNANALGDATSLFGNGREDPLGLVLRAHAVQVIVGMHDRQAELFAELARKCCLPRSRHSHNRNHHFFRNPIDSFFRNLNKGKTTMTRFALVLSLALAACNSDSAFHDVSVDCEPAEVIDEWSDGTIVTAYKAFLEYDGDPDNLVAVSCFDGVCGEKEWKVYAADIAGKVYASCGASFDRDGEQLDRPADYMMFACPQLKNP